MAYNMGQGTGGQMPQQPNQQANNQPQSMNLDISEENRKDFSGFMQGYKQALETKNANDLLPNISPLNQSIQTPPINMPQIPQGMQQQGTQPMPMPQYNMGGV